MQPQWHLVLSGLCQVLFALKIWPNSHKHAISDSDSPTGQKSSTTPWLGNFPVTPAHGMDHSTEQGGMSAQNPQTRFNNWIKYPETQSSSHLTLKTLNLTRWGCQYKTPSRSPSFWQLAANKAPAGRPIPGPCKLSLALTEHLRRV